MMAVNPFDYVNSITMTKKNMMRNSENDNLAEKDYNPWIVNKALSYFQDTVLIANEVNMYHALEKRAQYEYLINMVRPNKRWAKWVKDETNEELDLVCKYYNVNPIIGREYLSLLNKDQLTKIKAALDQGGNKK
jgi:hypothetical protein